MRFTPLILTLLTAPASTQWAQKALPEPADAVIAPPRIAVGVLSGASVEAVAGARGAVLLESIPALEVHLVETPRGTTLREAEALARELSRDPQVLYAEVDRGVQPAETPGCGQGGAVRGQPCTVAVIDGTPTPGEYAEQSALDRIQFAPAQALAQGASTIVAVLDTGLDFANPLFQGRVLDPGFDYVRGEPLAWDLANGRDDDGDGLVDEGVGHGSHVAGTILLIHPDALVLPLRVLDSDGNGEAFQVALAIVDAVDAGARVINLSLSTREPSIVIAAALGYAELLGVHVVTSAGNTGGEVLFPANYDPQQFGWILPLLPQGAQVSGDNVLAVTAVDGADLKGAFAAWGSHVDVCAPGVDIYSAHRGGDYAWWSGTSMAAGVASGALSLLCAVEGAGACSAAPFDALRATADPVDGLNPGVEGGLGAGRINVLAAAQSLVGN